MSVQLFTLIVRNPEPVFAWLAEHGGDHVVRRQAFSTVRSVWFVKVALDDLRLIDEFAKRRGRSTATLERHRARLAQISPT